MSEEGTKRALKSLDRKRPELGRSKSMPNQENPDGEENEEAYGYAFCKPRALRPNQSLRRLSNSIPDHCFQNLEVKIVDDDDENDLYPIDSETEQRIYLTSKRFMWNFANSFFEIAEKMGKRSLSVGAQYLAPSIICLESLDDFCKELKWKFIPSVEVGFWPDEGYEWFIRKRIGMRDKRTGVTYQWPTREQIDAARQTGCNIVPIGFSHPKKNITNPDEELEWRIQFNKAEMIIMRNLHHPKIRAYIFASLLHKAYLCLLYTSAAADE